MRTGAEVTLTRLRAEIIAIERASPELRLAQGRRAARRSLKRGDEPHAYDVGSGAEGGVGAHEAVLRNGGSSGKDEVVHDGQARSPRQEAAA